MHKNGKRKKTHQVGGMNSGLPRLLQFGTTNVLKYKKKFKRKCFKKHYFTYVQSKPPSPKREVENAFVIFILHQRLYFFVRFVSKTEYNRLSVMSDILHRLASANLLVA